MREEQEKSIRQKPQANISECAPLRILPWASQNNAISTFLWEVRTENLHEGGIFGATLPPQNMEIPPTTALNHQSYFSQNEERNSVGEKDIFVFRWEITFHIALLGANFAAKWGEIV